MDQDAKKTKINHFQLHLEEKVYHGNKIELHEWLKSNTGNPSFKNKWLSSIYRKKGETIPVDLPPNYTEEKILRVHEIIGYIFTVVVRFRIENIQNIKLQFYPAVLFFVFCTFSFRPAAPPPKDTFLFFRITSVTIMYMYRETVKEKDTLYPAYNRPSTRIVHKK